MKNGWIDVKEKLPKTDCIVNVLVEPMLGNAYAHIGQYGKYDGFFNRYGWYLLDNLVGIIPAEAEFTVIAWQPLPDAEFF